LTIMLSLVGVASILLLASCVSSAPLAESEGSNFQILSLIDRRNPQGPHFRRLNNVPGLQPTAKSFQVQWRPSFYSGIQTYQENLNKVQQPDARLQYQININGNQHRFQAPEKVLPVKPAPEVVVNKKADLVRASPAPSNSILGSSSGTLFENLRKQSKFQEAGRHFKYDFHPEEKLAMAISFE